MKEPKLYPILEAATLFGIPRSLLVNGVLNETLPTTMKFESLGNRQRARHFVTKEDAEAFYQEYLAAEETRMARTDAAEKKKWAKPADSYSHQARCALEDRALFKELAEYGVRLTDLG
jgi:hypothetical protein